MKSHAVGDGQDRLPEHIKTLTEGEELIRRRITFADAAPFLAHCELEESTKSRYVESFKTFLGGDASRIPAAFRNWPLTTIWNFSIALSQDYGDDGHAVYRVLNEAFDVEIADNELRNKISSTFRSICRKYGLCYDGSERFVNDYLAQAGVAKSQLHHVAKAFLSAERAFGPAPLDNTSALNSWEDEAVYYLPPGVRIPRMVLEVDETAHYAFLFSRYRQKQLPRNAFEQLFFDEISGAENSIAGGQQRAEVVPRPSLIWSQNGLALAIPKLEGRMSVLVAGEQRKLRGGQSWPLPTPWPTSIRWGFQEHSDSIPIMPSDRHILAFDQETARLISQIDSARETEVLLDAREVILAAAASFVVDGEVAYEVGMGGFASHCALGMLPTIVEMTSRTLRIRVKPKPRIWVDSGSVAKGTKGHLLGQNSTLGIEFGDLLENQFDLALSVGTREFIEPIEMSAPGCYAVYVLSGLEENSPELVPIRAELRLRGSNRALVRYKAWFWPGLREFRDERIFDSDQVPVNFSGDHSRHITRSQSGQLCLGIDAAYDKATLAFLVGHDRVDFEIPCPGVSLSFTDVEGRTVPLKIGETLIVRDEEKGGSLSVRCPDRLATLNVRGRAEPEAFKRTLTRLLSFADLLVPAPRDEISLEWSDRRHVPIILSRIVPAVCPRYFSIERKAETFELKIEMQIDVDAVSFILEDETGNRAEYVHAVAYRPVSSRPPNWLSAKLDSENTKQILISADLRKFAADLSLASILVRPAGSDTYCPLCNVRGDNYAVALKAFGAIDFEALAESADSRIRFMTLNSWMSQCFAQESWDQVGPRIQPRWMTLGKLLVDKPGGLAQLLLAAHQPSPAGAARSWVPLAHPLQILPSLYGSPAYSFVALITDTAEGSEHLALLAETAGKTIQEIHRGMGLSTAFLMAFANFSQALQSDLELSGFDFEKYNQRFKQLDTNPGARWFWQPGDELLGPAHYGAALGRMIDRLFEAGLEEEGANDARIRAATSLARAANKLQVKTLPLPRGIEETHAIFEFVPGFFSGFAQASRQGFAEKYLQDIADNLGLSVRSVIGDASFLIRLAPELFAYYLLLWELVIERNTQ